MTLLCPAEVTGVERRQGYAEASISDGDGPHTPGAVPAGRKLSARLLVIADGGRSPLRDQLGFKGSSKTYRQSALITTVRTDRPHHGLAYERFVGSGPLALLPMHDNDFAVVWTLEPADIDTFKDMSDQRLLARLQLACGNRAGTFDKLGSRQVYPLSLARVDQPTEPRVVAIGNAAHLVHPVAGQGFNLGLKDVADLAELIGEAHETGQDIGDAGLIGRYARNRRSRDAQCSRIY